MPAIVKGRASTQPRIVFWCGRSLEPWAPPSIDGTGIGGSETAVIQIAKRFAADGWRVDVYNEPDRYEGEYEGVGYWSISRLAAESAVDVFVSWRNPAAYDAPISRRLSLLWCHDLHSGPGREGELAKWDRVLGVSQWHADYLAQVYGLTNTDYVPNGIDPGRFATDVRKVPFRCVYASSPDRGLERVLEMWPFVLQMEPGAELHVGYGWDTIDQAIQHGAGDLIPVKARIQKALERTERVVWRGRLPQDELAKLYQESYFWLYPTSFLEVSCISAMEAMAGGCVPITSDTGALRGTIGNAGVFITGNTYTTAWREFYTLVVRGMLGDVGQRKRLARLGRERAAGLTWDASYEKWKRIVGEGNGEKKEARMLVEAGI
jgi:glycosyltransferase involved in cell wall biosynthesis